MDRADDFCVVFVTGLECSLPWNIFVDEFESLGSEFISILDCQFVNFFFTKIYFFSACHGRGYRVNFNKFRIRGYEALW